jgi:hypothetical protein
MHNDNLPRQHAQPGVESWFLRAVDPNSPRAFWLKATTLRDDQGQNHAEAWCSIFDHDQTFGAKATIPQNQARFDGQPLQIELASSSFVLDPDQGTLQGSIEDDRGALAWDLRMQRHPWLGHPLCLLPSRKLIDAPLPKNKLLTPMPALRFDGEITFNQNKLEVDGWWGSQGHNWGASHAREYAWGQCLFLDATGEPFCYAEGASGRIVVAGQTSPVLSMLTVRYQGREYRFDRLVDLWNQSPSIDFPQWSLRMQGAAGEAVILMDADPQRMVCLGYYNPDGSLAYCLNSKTAAVTLRVNPHDADAFECISPFGGALEFLQPTEEPRVQPVI